MDPEEYSNTISLGGQDEKIEGKFKLGSAVCTKLLSWSSTLQNTGFIFLQSFLFIEMFPWGHYDERSIDSQVLCSWEKQPEGVGGREGGADGGRAGERIERGKKAKDHSVIMWENRGPGNTAIATTDLINAFKCNKVSKDRNKS